MPRDEELQEQYEDARANIRTEIRLARSGEIDRDYCTRCFHNLPWSHEIENEEVGIEECRSCGGLRIISEL